MAEPSGKHRLRWLVVALILTIFLAIVSFPLSACLNSGYGSDERVLAVPAECDEDFTQVGTYVLFYEKQGLTDVPVIHPGGRIEYPDGLSVEISNSGKGVVPTGLAWGIMEQGPWSGSILRGPQVTIAAPGLYHFSLQFATAKPATPWRIQVTRRWPRILGSVLWMGGILLIGVSMALSFALILIRTLSSGSSREEMSKARPTQRNR